MSVNNVTSYKIKRMSVSAGLRVLVFIYLSKDVSGVITNAPLNAVAEVGQQAIFNCTSDIPSPNWVLSAKREDFGTTASKNIVYGCVVQTGFTTHYSVDRPGGNINICNLIVNDTTMQQAGIYTCTDSAPGPSAMLTVIDASPVITVNNTNDAITAVENDIVVIECVLNYNGTMPPAPTLRPFFYWTDSSGQNVSSSYDSTTENTAVSQLTVTAGRTDIMPYTCHVYVQLTPPINSGYATNTPTVSSSATSPTIEVLSAEVSTKLSIVSESTATITTTSRPTTTVTVGMSSTQGSHTDVDFVAAIAVGAVLFVSVALNIVLLIFMIRTRMQKHDAFQRTGTDVTMLEPETPDLSIHPPPPSTYEGLTRSNEIHLRPTIYEELTPKPPIYVNDLGLRET